MNGDVLVSTEEVVLLADAASELAEASQWTISETIAHLESMATDQDNHADVRAWVRVNRRFRVLRNARLGAPIFRDPAWDMLLDLLDAEGNEKRLSVSALCIGSGVAPTTALRHLEKLVQYGFVTREDDFVDERRVFVNLVPAKRDRLIQLLSEWQRAEASPGKTAKGRSSRDAQKRQRKIARSSLANAHPVFLS
jgi:DNA-binding MarR family transcriptional regulator